MNKLQVVSQAIANYFARFPDEEVRLDRLSRQLRRGDDLTDRKNFTGHVTGSGLVILDGKILLVFHRILQIFLQPGGHYENDESLSACALREVEEETGIRAFTHPWHESNRMVPMHIDTHFIPENKKKAEKSHFHHDCVFVMSAQLNQDIELQAEEVASFKLVSFEECHASNVLNSALLKMKREHII